MQRITRVSLLDVARGCPGSHGSTTVPTSPRSLKRIAVHWPMPPAPPTTMSGVRSPRSPPPRCSAVPECSASALEPDPTRPAASAPSTASPAAPAPSAPVASPPSAPVVGGPSRPALETRDEDEEGQHDQQPEDLRAFGASLDGAGRLRGLIFAPSRRH